MFKSSILLNLCANSFVVSNWEVKGTFISGNTHSIFSKGLFFKFYLKADLSLIYDINHVFCGGS